MKNQTLHTVKFIFIFELTLEVSSQALLQKTLKVQNNIEMKCSRVQVQVRTPKRKEVCQNFEDVLDGRIEFDGKFKSQGKRRKNEKSLIQDGYVQQSIEKFLSFSNGPTKAKSGNVLKFTVKKTERECSMGSTSTGVILTPKRKLGGGVGDRLLPDHSPAKRLRLKPERVVNSSRIINSK